MRVFGRIRISCDTISKEAIYIAVGICVDGSKKVLAYTIAPTESVYNWQEPLEELKERSVEDRQEICEDFKTIHQASDAEAAGKRPKHFVING